VRRRRARCRIEDKRAQAGESWCTMSG
jgi:hypothetical protein